MRKEERKVRKKSVYNAARTNDFYTAEEKTMRTETKTNDVTIRHYDVNDLPKTAKNLDGFVMRIKEFRNWMDCDVIFDDTYEDDTEAIVRHVCPGLYLTGNIIHPQFVMGHKSFPYAKIGKIQTAANGKKYCIIDAANNHSVTIMTEDGSTIDHRNPNYIKRGFFGLEKGTTAMHSYNGKEYTLEVGLTLPNKDGDLVKILEIGKISNNGSGTRRIDVEVTHDNEAYKLTNQTEAAFWKGSLTVKKAKRLAHKMRIESSGESLPKMLNTSDGHRYILESIQLNSRLEVLVDGVGRKNVARTDYLNGTIKLGEWYKAGRNIIEHETAFSNKNDLMRITAYRTAMDVDIEIHTPFGVQNATHRTIDNFRKGKITPDDAQKEAARIAENKIAKRFAVGLGRTGRLSMNRAGQRMGIMKVHADGLLDVVFEETGNVKKGQTWYAFQHGLILDADSTPEVLMETMQKLEGETPDVNEFRATVFGTQVAANNVSAATAEKIAETVASKLESVWGIRNQAIKSAPKETEDALIVGIRRFVNTVNILAIGRLPSIREYMKALANYAEGNILSRLEAGEDVKDMQIEIEIMLDVANEGTSAKTGDKIFDERYAAAVMELQKALKAGF